jgi:multidrug efflux pump
LEAVRLRLRPILMTSLAFILGVLPLALASGAGSASQQAIGIGVVGGMLSGTLLAIFLVPVFFVIVQRMIQKMRDRYGAAQHSTSPRNREHSS